MDFPRPAHRVCSPEERLSAVGGSRWKILFWSFPGFGKNCDLGKMSEEISFFIFLFLQFY